MTPNKIPTKVGKFRFWWGLCARCGMGRLFRGVWCLACWLELGKEG